MPDDFRRTGPQEDAGHGAVWPAAENQQLAIVPFGVVQRVIPGITGDDLQLHIGRDDAGLAQFRQCFLGLGDPACEHRVLGLGADAGGEHGAPTHREGDHAQRRM
ncbi:Uncharacterised protein [Mycobacteroides abscessus subsp. abscessus]|nr:Uncharacterised protein [Mycobacteroides abscessus subsp. abscessus]